MAQVVSVFGGFLYEIRLDNSSLCVPEQFTKKFRPSSDVLWLTIVELSFAVQSLKWVVSFQSPELECLYSQALDCASVQRSIVAYTFLTLTCGLALRHAETSYGVPFIGYRDVRRGHGEFLIDFVVDTLPPLQSQVIERVARSVGKRHVSILVDMKTKACTFVAQADEAMLMTK